MVVIDDLMCDGNGEILVSDIIETINKLINRCKQIEDCCNEMRQRSFIRTLRVNNILYITDDGSAPR